MSAGLKRWKPYPEYKESGVEWLGEVPAGWEVKRLKFIATCNTSSVDKLSKDDEIDILLCNYTDVYKNDIISNELHFMQATATQDEIKRFSIEEECVIITKDSESWTDIAIPAYVATGLKNVLCGYHLAIIRSETIQGKFLFYLLSSRLLNQQFQLSANGVTRFGLPQSGVSNALLLAPAPFEQQTIAAFLDQQCAQIDSLIEKKQRMLDLLDEKRRAAITQAVTRGLDPSVPMQDSGVEWLGMVPEGWEVNSMQPICSEFKAGPFGSSLTKEMYSSSGYRVYGQEQVIPNDFSIGDYYIDSEKFSELKQYAICEGDILISCVGTFGKIAIVPCGIEPGIINPRLIRIRVAVCVNPKYLAVFLCSPTAYSQFCYFSRGGTMDIINIGIIKQIQIPLPPLHEQQAIADYLDAQCAAMDSQRKSLEKSIELLREYRSSLITHAVTGKIDVRELAPLQ